MMVTPDKPPNERLLPSWIAGFYEYTDGIPSPSIFRRWAAIAAVAGALERRVWVHSSGGFMYPNMFLLFLAPPGVGKDQAINPVADIWASCGCFSVAPVSLTHKGLIDQLADPSSSKQLIDKSSTPPAWINYHSLLIAAPELGVLLPSYDLGYISALNELFNCREIFEERMRMFVDNSNYLWQIGSDLKPQRLGYQEFMESLKNDSIVGSLNPALREFHISDGVHNYLLTPYGLCKV